MKTDIAQAAADVAVQKAVAGTASAASGAVSIGFGDWIAAAIGAPFLMLLAAFAGAAGVLSFLPPRPLVRAIGTVATCTLIGAYCAPWASRAWPILNGGEKFIAIALAAALQILLPIVIEQGSDVLRGIRRRMGIGDGPGDGPGAGGGQ